MEKIRAIIELPAFGVCTYLGEKLELPSSKIRLYFIYSSFIAFGSPIIIYLFLAFFLQFREYLTRSKRLTIWDI